MNDVLLNRRREMMQVGGGRLPSEYQEIEYLKSTGTQWILTPFSFGLNFDTIISRVLPLRYECTHVASYFANVTTFLYLRTNGWIVNFFARTGSGDYSSDLFDFYNVTDMHTIEISNTPSDGFVAKADGVVKYSNNYKNFTTPQLGLFGRYRGSNTCDSLYQQILGEQHFILGGILVGDFIPCYRISDNKPGMYDIVNDVFYTNNGTGEFEIGQNVN